jgi:sensor histidine kinase YesM
MKALKMMGIRTKIFLYFIVFVVLLNGVAFFIYESSEDIVSEYDYSFKRLLLLNEISQQTNNMVEQLNAYLVEKEQSYLQEYERQSRMLRERQKHLNAFIENEKNEVLLRNYKNMINSFIEEGALTIYHFQIGNIQLYSTHFHKFAQTSSFIQETTLSLLDHELTAYQRFYDQIEERNRYFRYMGMSLFCTTLTLSALLALWFSGGITKPIERLSRAALEIASGKLEGKDVQVTTNDEFKLLTETFNNMRRNIRDLVEEMKKKSELDQLVKELELRSLQNQINPHFLFNTLNVVAKMAYLEDANQTSRLIEAVAAILRYNLGDLNRTVTLADEIKSVKEYFFIQQTRFFDRIKIMTELDETGFHVPIPPLTLQPLIENAFIHGIESYEEGAVFILRVFVKENDVIVEVSDNGLGMSEETKERLLSFVRGEQEQGVFGVGNARGHSTGIGIRNVIRRLQLFYDKLDVVEIESVVGQGTTIRLKLPMNVKIHGGT